MKSHIPKNLDKAPIEVWHIELDRECDESAYRSKCPFCKNGIFLVARIQKTMQLSRYDRCVSCGQLIKYLDPHINHEIFGD
jgi:hypothetical protein